MKDYSNGIKRKLQKRMEYNWIYNGFKWIASVIRNRKAQRSIFMVVRESYGFVKDYVRDKDSAGSISMIAEIAARAHLSCL